MRAGEYLRINAPALAFLAAASLATYLAVRLTGLERLIAIALAWWCGSGVVMLLVDFRRKREVFHRLLTMNRDGLAGGHETIVRAPDSLRQTICGWCIIWAARSHARRKE